MDFATLDVERVGDDRRDDCEELCVRPPNMSVKMLPRTMSEDEDIDQLLINECLSKPVLFVRALIIGACLERVFILSFARCRQVRMRESYARLH